MSIIGLLGAQAAKSAVSGITSGLSGSIGQQLSYGLGDLTGYNQKLRDDQYNQQKRLSELQQSFNFESMDKAQEQTKELQQFSYDLTSPANQVRRLKEAGLNPALMYGMGGASGGTIAGNATPVNGGGGHAADETARASKDSAIS